MGLLDGAQSICELHQKIIVSRDNGSECKHVAINDQLKCMRQYKLDGEVFKNEKSCDFLLLNDTDKDAYFIELKGRHIELAIYQLQESFNRVRPELAGYNDLYRLVASKVKSHGVQSSIFRKFKIKKGKRFKCGVTVIEENV